MLVSHADACESAVLQASGATPREESMMVRVLDVKTLSWAVLTPSGDAPPARGSHSVRAACCVGRSYRC